MSHRVTDSAPYRGLRSNGTSFYLSENPFLFPPNFPDFLPKWKAPFWTRWSNTLFPTRLAWISSDYPVSLLRPRREGVITTRSNRMKFRLLQGPLKWSTAAKNANVSWLLNFRIRVFLKSAVNNKFKHFFCFSFISGTFGSKQRTFSKSIVKKTWLRHGPHGHFVPNKHARISPEQHVIN